MESRLKKSITAGGRHTRASEDHSRLPAEESFASTQDIDQMWSDEWTQSALPKVPDIPGFHLCWLSTTNSYDTIDKRIRLGYTPVLADELPGFENYRVKAGEHVGHISCNEMLLFKIPMDLYQRVMTHFHYQKPMEATQAIMERMEELQQGVDSSGHRLLKTEGEGFGNVAKSSVNRPPVFEG
jgi:hypothetical protein